MTWTVIVNGLRGLQNGVCVLLFEKSPNNQAKLWAFLYKIFFLAGLGVLLLPTTEDVHEIGRRNVIFWSVLSYLGTLFIIYRLNQWDSWASEMRRLPIAEWEEWKAENRLLGGVVSFIKFIVLPIAWPLFAAFLGTRFHRFSILLVFSLFGCSFMAFIFTRRWREDYGTVDTLVSVNAGIFFGCEGERCKREPYLAFLTVAVPIILKRGIPYLCNWYWHPEEDQIEGNRHPEEDQIEGNRHPEEDQIEGEVVEPKEEESKKTPDAELISMTQL